MSYRAFVSRLADKRDDLANVYDKAIAAHQALLDSGDTTQRLVALKAAVATAQANTTRAITVAANTAASFDCDHANAQSELLDGQIKTAIIGLSVTTSALKAYIRAISVAAR